MKRSLQNAEFSLDYSDPVAILHTGLRRIEARLDRCAETCRVYGLVWPVPAPTDSLETKLRMLGIYLEEEDDSEKSIQWLGECIMMIQTLLAHIEAAPKTAEQTILTFLDACWPPTNTACEQMNQRLQQVLDGLGAVLDALDEAWIRTGEEKLLREARDEQYIEMMETWRVLFSQKSSRST